MIAGEPSAERRHTAVSIVGDEFYINGKPTYVAQTWRGRKIQGLLLNARLVQGIFDDRNTNTVSWWSYPDSGRWDYERNTREFIAAMLEWRQHGLLAITINLQGGSPRRGTPEGKRSSHGGFSFAPWEWRFGPKTNWRPGA